MKILVEYELSTGDNLEEGRCGGCDFIDSGYKCKLFTGPGSTTWLSGEYDLVWAMRCDKCKTAELMYKDYQIIHKVGMDKIEKMAGEGK